MAEAMSGTGEPAAAAPGSEELPKGGRSLVQAVATAVVLLALVALCAYLGTTAFFVLICVVVLTALFEVYDAVVQAGGKPSVVLGMLAGLGMLLAAFFERPALLPVVVALTMYGAFVLALRPGRGSSASTDVAWTLLGVAWIGGGGAGATARISWACRLASTRWCLRSRPGSRGRGSWGAPPWRSWPDSRSGRWRTS